MEKGTTKQYRLPPEIRKKQILDHAAEIVRNHGALALNMERLARAASVSKPLIYTYFGNRKGVLKSLLINEVEANQARELAAANAATSISELVRVTSRGMLENIAQRGNIMQQLMNEPDIADVLEELHSESHQRNVAYLAGRIAEAYDLPYDKANLLVDLGLGLSNAAGVQLDKGKGDIDLIEEMLVTMILGSIDAVAQKYANAKI